MQLLIRQGTPADASSIAQVHVESWVAAYRGLLPDGMIEARTVELRTCQWTSDLGSPVPNLVACDANGQVQAFASAEVLDESQGPFQSYLRTLYVRPQFWRRGIGRELLRALCSRLLALGVQNLALRTLRLGHARKFYECLGARSVPEGIAQDAGRFDDLVYAFDDLTSIAR